MQQHNDVSRHVHPDAWGQLEMFRSRSRLPALAAVLVFGLAALACSFLSPASQTASDRAVMLNRLPTFTRTPLPPLVSLDVVTPAAATIAGDAVPTAPGEGTLPTAPPASRAENPLDQGSSAVPAPAASSSTVPAPASTAAAANAPATTTFVAPAENALPTDPLAAAAPEASLALTPATTSLPPASPTSAAPATTVPIPTSTPTATATNPPTPTSIPTAVPTATSLPAGWVFSGVRVSTGDDDNMQVYGNVINNTGAAQEIDSITGIFYDGQGKVIADRYRVLEYWPLVEIVPPGGQVPFELTVLDVENAADFDLSVEAEPSDLTPRQDFEFVDVKQELDDGFYCLEGRTRNLGGPLQYELTIVATLYDAQDKVINFSDFYEPAPTTLTGDQTLEFGICIDPLDQGVARHELHAWGN